MLKKYILFDGHTVMCHNDTEFVSALRKSSWFTIGKTDSEYMRGFKKRLLIYKETNFQIDIGSPSLFVNSLKNNALVTISLLD